MKKIFGIDFGKSHIGIAEADLETKIALPYARVDAGKNLTESVENVFRSLTPQLPYIEKIVLGRPLLMSGKASTMALLVEEFAKLLEEKMKIPIELWDERLTSSQADKTLKESGMTRKKRAKHSDYFAAMIILQSFLDAKYSSI